MKKKVLIVYPEMMIGGSTTSLLSMLDLLDYDRYDVDLLLFKDRGEWLHEVPACVGRPAPCYRYPNDKQRLWHQLCSPRFMAVKLKARKIQKQSGSHKLGQQYLEMRDVDFYRDAKGHYDVAIAFLEGQPCKYTANHVSADRKIGWIHVDYEKSGFRPEYDREAMAKFDRIVTVSDACLASFNRCFPELCDRTVMIENILSKKRLRRMSEQDADLPSLDEGCIRLVTTCRISFASKALDRAVRAFARLHKEAPHLTEKLRWYILGDGDDMPTLREMIADLGLSDRIFPLGAKDNPYPFLRPMSLFFLPSLWEGKPMAVTEAQILGLPVLVTDYSSAKEQVEDGVTGRIVENSEEGVYGGLFEIAANPALIDDWRRATAARCYENPSEIQKIEALLNG